MFLVRGYVGKSFHPLFVFRGPDPLKQILVSWENAYFGKNLSDFQRTHCAKNQTNKKTICKKEPGLFCAFTRELCSFLYQGCLWHGNFYSKQKITNYREQQTQACVPNRDHVACVCVEWLITSLIIFFFLLALQHNLRNVKHMKVILMRGIWDVNVFMCKLFCSQNYRGAFLMIFMGAMSREAKGNPNSFSVWKDLDEFNFKISKVGPFLKMLIYYQWRPFFSPSDVFHNLSLSFYMPHHSSARTLVMM